MAAPPLTLPPAAQLFDDFFVADRPGHGRWQVAGRRRIPRRSTVPALSFVSTTDRIVPAASAAARRPSAAQLAMGHVGMIVGGRARDALWQPLADWLTALAPTR